VKFADVAVNVPLRAGDRVFTFSIPPALASRIEPGIPVRIKFGPRSTSGYVVRLLEEVDRQVRPLSGIDDRLPVLPPDLLSLAEWMAGFYVCTVGEALAAMLPPLSGIPATRRSAPSGTGRRRAAPSEPAIIHAPPTGRDAGDAPGDPPTAAVEHLLAALAPGRQVALIGGGARFAAYAAAVREALAAGSSTILLVPEVAQAERLAPWLAGKLGAPVVILHGAQPPAIRWATWRYLQANGPLAVVGTRLAAFAPVRSLGLVVVEHEEDTSYKEERMPRYLTRRVVGERAALTGAAVVWGTPAPSVDLMGQVEEGRVASVSVPSSAAAAIAIADVRSDAGPLGGLFGRRLYQALARTLPTGHAIVFVPRRGYADFLLCHECGAVPKCPRCDVAMTYHVPGRTLRCHLCGREDPAPTVCASCGGTSLRPHGIGTERVEAAARRLFKRTPILRLDSDVAPEEPDQLRTWQQFARRGGLVIGTQLLVKGVGQVASDVVGALGVDAALNLPEFTAAERTFQILTQLVDLARKEAVIQTFSPQHPVMLALRRREPQVFYRQELAARRRFGYPPFRTLINLVVSGSAADDAQKVAGALAGGLEPVAEVLGPSPAPLPKMRGRVRWQVLVKDDGDGAARRALPGLLTTLEIPRTVKVVIDVDPVDLL
jgi:primosomal protein N' (replication factor Y)